MKTGAAARRMEPVRRKAAGVALETESGETVQATALVGIELVAAVETAAAVVVVETETAVVEVAGAVVVGETETAVGEVGIEAVVAAAGAVVVAQTGRMFAMVCLVEAFEARVARAAIETAAEVARSEQYTAADTRGTAIALPEERAHTAVAAGAMIAVVGAGTAAKHTLAPIGTVVAVAIPVVAGHQRD